MVTARGFAVALVVLIAVPAPRVVADIVLPTEVASYKSWQPLLGRPHPVSEKLWMRCTAPTKADWEAERRRVGPHAERLIMVYGNPAAATAAKARKPFPPGSLIAKEKLRSEASGGPDGVAFMVKRTDARFRDTGGWEFLYYPTSGDERATHEQCASCHRNATRDYVFGEYPR